MRTYHSNEIGNVAVLGHSGSGKTSVIEAMAFRCGLTSRIGTIKEGNTLSDYDEEEVKRQTSLSLSVIPLEWNNCKVNLLDTPGAFDFAGETQAALSVCESALLVVPASRGLTMGTRQAMYKAHEKAKIIYINGIDHPHASYHEKLKELQEAYGKVIAPIQVPIMDGEKMVGYVNVAKMEGRYFENGQTHPCPIPDDMWDEVQPVKAMIDEAVANTSDELLEKYLNEEPFTREEISLALRHGVVSKSLIPVLCGTDTIGISIILNSIVAFFSAAGDTSNSYIAHNLSTKEDEIIGFDESLAPGLFVFKTFADPFVGRISLFKVTTGSLTPNMTLINGVTKEEEHLGKLYMMTGKKLEEVDVLHAGDIGAAMKLSHTHTNDTLSTPAYLYTLDPIHYPTPYYGQALVARGKANEEKISQALSRILEEDPTLNFITVAETTQQCLYGLGDIHLASVVAKLKTKFKIDVSLEPITITYRETIQGIIKKRTKYKKQSGGHGQYGDVEILFEPSYDYSLPYIFEENVFGGAVPKSYFPAVEKGLAEATKHGVLAGYPVLGIKATLLDGSYHSVDSSEQAFKTATMMCFKEAIPEAKPILLEPYVTMHVYSSDDYTGDLMSHFNKHRARVIGQEILDDGLVKITAQAPLGEVMNYAIDLRSITQGQGFYDQDFLDYEFVSDALQTKIIKEAQNNKG